jgi:hypothetical protein
MKDGIIPRFFIGYRLTERRGVTIRKIEQRVQLILPGNRFSAPAMPVMQEHIDRWPDQYLAFRARQSYVTLMRLGFAKFIDWVRRKRQYGRALVDVERETAMNILYESDAIQAASTREKLHNEQRQSIRAELDKALADQEK